MIEFIKNNTLLFVFIVLILIFALLFFIIKTSKSKTKSTIKKENNNSDDKTESEKTAKEGEDNPNLNQKSDKSSKKRVKKVKEQKSVEKIFKREETAKSEDVIKPQQESVSSISEEELLSKMEFVKSSKRVSKLVKVSKEDVTEGFETLITEESYLPPEENSDEYDKKLRKNFHLKQHSKYFDKSKRLFRFIKEDNFDDMFNSHISDDYLNIDISRHLDTSENVLNKLYNRASETIANSDKRLISEDDDEQSRRKVDKDFNEAYIEKRKREIFAELISSDNRREDENENMRLGEIDIDDVIKLDSKTILVADAVLNRKGKKK